MSVRIIKAMSKSELARRVGISATTLRKWLKQCAGAFKQMGISQNAKMLPPCAVKVLCEKYSIDLYDDEL
jgi:transposase-like protein